MLTEYDWPVMDLAGLHVERCPRWSGLRDVTPYFTRSPYGDWCLMFTEECEMATDLDWKEAGFVRCEPDRLKAVERRLEQVTEVANGRFRSLLANALLNQTAAAEDLIKLEQSLAAAKDGVAYLCTTP